MKFILGLILLCTSLFTCSQSLQKTQNSQNKATMSAENNDNLEIATLGGGCFWCLEAVYLEMQGVQKVVSGYMGGQVENPTYRAVCAGTTGHAEVVQITFDPMKTSFVEILEVFWAIHDPTTLNRQGADVGSQYRSAIFYHNEGQAKIALASKAAAEEATLWPDPIVTEISEISKFYPAEEYHQDYYANNPYQGYCVAVVAPKVKKFKKLFKDKLKEEK